MNSPVPQLAAAKSRTRKRPFICTVILSAALTYFLVLALVFLAALIFSGKISDAVSVYYDPGDGPPYAILWFSLTGAMLYVISAVGIILFLLSRKAGFYLFFTAAVAIFALDLAFLSFDWMRYLIHTGFIFLLGIAHFTGKCYNIKAKADRT